MIQFNIIGFYKILHFRPSEKLTVGVGIGSCEWEISQEISLCIINTQKSIYQNNINSVCF